jgi:crotonobetainyl-CoA:carnitine CoA-transferase CaiB-like acyl-CoA transferase
LGLDDESLRARYPRLVFCNTRGYEKGPRSELPGTDQTAAALTGVEWEDGACDAGNPPLWSRSSMGDTGNALLAATAIAAALYHRERSGVGQSVSTSIVNAGLLVTSYAWIHADGRRGDWRGVDGTQTGLSPWYRLYECADGWICVAAVTSAARAALAAVAGAGGDTEDTDKLVAALEARFRDRPAATWWSELDARGVPVEVVDQTFCRRMFDDPALRDRGWLSETWAGGVGRFEDPGVLIDFSETPGRVPRGPCLCGQHTREVLQELGYPDGDIDALAADRVILDAPVTR